MKLFTTSALTKALALVMLSLLLAAESCCGQAMFTDYKDYVVSREILLTCSDNPLDSNFCLNYSKEFKITRTTLQPGINVVFTDKDFVDKTLDGYWFAMTPKSYKLYCPKLKTVFCVKQISGSEFIGNHLLTFLDILRR